MTTPAPLEGEAGSDPSCRPRQGRLQCAGDAVRQWRLVSGRRAQIVRRAAAAGLIALYLLLSPTAREAAALSPAALGTSGSAWVVERSPGHVQARPGAPGAPGSSSAQARAAVTGQAEASLLAPTPSTASPTPRPLVAPSTTPDAPSGTSVLSTNRLLAPEPSTSGTAQQPTSAP